MYRVKNINGEIARNILKWFIRFFCRIPYKMAVSIARSCGFLVWAFNPFFRKVAITQMKSVLGSDYKRGMSMKVFMNHGDLLIDTLRFAMMDDDEVKRRIHVEGLHYFEEALKTGRGIMMITGHIGNWELSANIARLTGKEFCVMADQRKDPLLEDLVDSIRSRTGATILPPSGRALMLIRELRRGRTIGFIVDKRGEKNESIICDVFGLPAPTNPAPAIIALKGRAIIIPTYAIKHGQDYVFTFDKPIDTVDYTGDNAVHRLSSDMQKWVESIVRKYPEHWFWLYSRWLRRSQIRKVVGGQKDFREYVLECNRIK